MEKICNCKIPKNLQADQMAESIAAYVTSIPKEQCVSDKEYERRLFICSECSDLSGGITCMHCGCFVLARARKKDMYCPAPSKNKWEK